MVRVSSLAKLRPWSELTAKMVMGVVPGLVIVVVVVVVVALPLVLIKRHPEDLCNQNPETATGNCCPRRNSYWINSGKVWSNNSWDLFISIIALRLIPVICTARRAKPENCKKKNVVNSSQGLSHNKVSNFSEINSQKHFSGSAVILVPTADN